MLFHRSFGDYRLCFMPFARRRTDGQIKALSPMLSHSRQLSEWSDRLLCTHGTRQLPHQPQSTPNATGATEQTAHTEQIKLPTKTFLLRQTEIKYQKPYFILFFVCFVVVVVGDGVPAASALCNPNNEIRLWIGECLVSAEPLYKTNSAPRPMVCGQRCGSFSYFTFGNVLHCGGYRVYFRMQSAPIPHTHGNWQPILQLPTPRCCRFGPTFMPTLHPRPSTPSIYRMASGTRGTGIGDVWYNARTIGHGRNFDVALTATAALCMHATTLHTRIYSHL